MNVTEIINRVWTDCGEPSDLNPTVDSTQLVSYLNTSLDCVVTWKGYQGRRRAKFPDYIQIGYKKNLREDETVAGTSTDFDVIELTTLPSTFTVAVGDFVEYDSEIRLIYAIDTTHLYLDSGFSTDPTDETVTICQALMDPAFTRVMSFLRVEDVEDTTTLERIRKPDSSIGEVNSSGTPTAWMRRNGQIEFNVIPDKSYLWKIWYYRLPTQATTADYLAGNDIDLPEEFHIAAEAYMKSLVYKQMQEPDASMNEYRVFDNLMKTIQGSWEQESMLEADRTFKVAVQ